MTEKKPLGVIISEDNDFIHIECPYCKCIVVCHRKDTHCKQFIHAVDEKTGKPLNPHKSVGGKKFVGCGGRFRLGKKMKKP